ncbi:MAG TPA: DoxX family protein [Xanthobacteraceae bacterium]|nr:DoxX family protein [Xanthobacteraceae bacterium]
MNNDLISLIGRALLAALFIVSGWGKVTAVGAISQNLASKGFPMPQVFGYLVALIELGGGLLILAGYQTRWVAALLAVHVVGTIFVGHPFWTMQDAARAQNMTQALKNLSIIGGFLMLAVAGPGRFSIDGARER